jgi:hypothetical protein
MVVPDGPETSLPLREMVIVFTADPRDGIGQEALKNVKPFG